MSRILAALFLAISYFVCNSVSAADPVAGRVDYPLELSTIDASSGFWFTGTVWEVVGNTHVFGPLRFRGILWANATKSVELSRAEDNANSWGGFYKMVPSWGYVGNLAYFEFLIQDDAGAWQIQNFFPLNVVP